MNLPSLSSEPQVPLRDPNRVPFNSPMHDRMCLTGLALGVLAGALVLIGAFGSRVIASSASGSFGGGPRRAIMEQSGFIVIGLISVIALILAIALPFAWARITGIGVLVASAMVCLIIVVAGRSDDRFLFREGPSLGRGGWILYIAGLVFTIGLVLALVGAPRIGRGPIPGGVVATSGYAIAGLVLSLCGIFGGATAAIGVAMSIAGLDDIKRSEGTRGGRGLAIAGLVVGIVILAFGAAFGLIGGLVAEPTLSNN